ncbi:hypothetical protein FGO68_gene11942 [Halteria grandinella]|uniref:Transmembrane protein n=1 Tax=Halteria grandinella TaxID=5974 RepID=A0A8J8NM08_HALGN|nr:hypothetical protein FGO68_gene11942 [Halteria grandinella]
MSLNSNINNRTAPIRFAFLLALLIIVLSETVNGSLTTHKYSGAPRPQTHRKITLMQNSTNSTNSTANTVKLWQAYNRTCFGCVVAGYKYCKQSQICIPIGDNCTLNASQEVYTKSTGCPISTQCQFGMNGLVFVSANAAPASTSTQVSNATSNSTSNLSTSPLVFINGSQDLIVPADKPCVIGFVNYLHQNLTLSFTNQNVSAYLFTLIYPSQTLLTPVQPEMKINLTKSEDMAYLYIGSINNQSAQTKLQWSKWVQPAPPGPKPWGKGAASLQAALAGVVITLCTLYI